MRLGLAVLLVVLGWCWSLQPVAACVVALPEPFTIDPSLEDVAPPTTFRDVHAVTRQISGTRCEGKTCTSSSCGDDGTIELTFTAPEDDRGAVGYRVIWRGAPPAGVTGLADGIVTLGDAHTIVLHPGFDAVTQLDGELSLIAVDHAGNESAPSAPVHVSWSGCMSYFDAPDRCVQHTESCTIAAPGARRAGMAMPLMAAGLCALLVRRRRRRVGARRHV